MRPNERRGAVTHELLQLWDRPFCADMRFGQLIQNILRWNGLPLDYDVWEIEDDTWLEMIREADRVVDELEGQA